MYKLAGAEKWDKTGGAALGEVRTGPVRGLKENWKIKQKIGFQDWA